MNWRKFFEKLKATKPREADLRRIIDAVNKNHISQQKVREIASPDVLKEILPELKKIDN